MYRQTVETFLNQHGTRLVTSFLDSVPKLFSSKDEVLAYLEKYDFFYELGCFMAYKKEQLGEADENPFELEEYEILKESLKDRIIRACK